MNAYLTSALTQQTTLRNNYWADKQNFFEQIDLFIKVKIYQNLNIKIFQKYYILRYNPWDYLYKKCKSLFG